MNLKKAQPLLLLLAIAVTGMACMPVTVPDDPPVAAVPQEPQLSFAGQQWTIKQGAGQGPGPNDWDARNAWVDQEGLHLRIAERDGRWTAAEVFSNRSFSYGRYVFKVAGESHADQLDQNVVLGLFTWSNSPESAHRELDIELGWWGYPDSGLNRPFVVQPSEQPGHISRFPVRLPGDSTPFFDWQPDN